jgi:hypothetical protein
MEDLILALLAKEPGARPASANEVLAALEGIDTSERSRSRSDSQANPLEALAHGAFVGRAPELERLRGAFDVAMSGRGSVVMLVGEPGIGKTRTTQELETYARMRGAYTFWGRTHESAGAPSYWPWVQVGNAWGAAVDLLSTGAAAIRQGMGNASELSRLFPSLRQLPGFVEPETVSDPDAAQFRLFDAYAQFMRDQSQDKPWLIVLDDLHWADAPTLKLLQHIARELASMPVLVVGTYRDTDIGRTHPLSETLAELNRESGFLRVTLRGLSRDEVAAYVHAIANIDVAPAFIDRLHEETEGNPFFLAEVVNLLVQEGALKPGAGAEIALPDGVREALGRRLDRLSEDANQLLAYAAVAGREFSYDTLQLARGDDDELLLRLLEEALAARVIEETGRAGRYRFTHALMQETLLDELSTTRRVGMHGGVGTALEQRYGARADEHAAELAHHFVESAALNAAHAERAAHYSRSAAENAEAQAGWGEAVRHYTQVLALIDERGVAATDAETAALQLRLGISARNSGDQRVAWRSLMRAADHYRRLGDGVAFATTVVEATTVPGAIEREAPPLLLEALELLAEADPHLEAQLQAFLVIGGLHPVAAEHVRAARDRANELVRMHDFDDVRAQLHMAAASDASSASDYERAVTERDEAFRLFARLQMPDRAALAASLRSAVASPLGRIDEFVRLSVEGLEYASRYRIRYPEEALAAYLALAKLLRCDFAAFEALAKLREGDYNYTVPGMRARRAECAGDLEGALGAMPDATTAGSAPGPRAQVHALRARTFWNAGRESDARAEYAACRRATDATPWAQHYPGGAVNDAVLDPLDDAIVPLSDEAYLATLEEHIGALEGRGLEWPMANAPCIGSSLQRIFATIMLARGRVDDAATKFAKGLAWAEREHVPIEAGRCHLGLAEVEERRGQHTEAMQHLDAAGELFARHGAKLYLDQVIAKKSVLGA